MEARPQMPQGSNIRCSTGLTASLRAIQQGYSSPRSQLFMLTMDLHGRTLPAAFEGIADSLPNPLQRNGTPHISRHTKPGDRRFPIEHMPSAHLNPPPTLERLYAAQGVAPGTSV